MTHHRFIDTHVNLHGPQFNDDLAEVVARARSAGVVGQVAICDRFENLPAVRAVAVAQPDFIYSAGAHPHYAKDHLGLTVGDLLAAASDPRCGAIGETGLDQHYGHSTIEDQIAVLKVHVEAARQTGLPLIIHTRNADNELSQVLRDEMSAGTFRFLLHCYTSGLELARLGWSLGGFISFSGIMTFKNAEDVRAVAREAPLDRVVLETDCPYLAPPPHRGRRCEPFMIAEVYRSFATLRGLELATLCDRVEQNARVLFPRLPA
jgi:TatD DNase family protein